jgi:fucokinase
VDSRLSGGVTWQGRGIVANVITDRPLRLGRDVVVHQLAVGNSAGNGASNGYVTRLFGLTDDPKRARSDPSATFLGRPWAAWLDEMGIDPSLLWPDLPEREQTLWTARLFPHVDDRETSLELALPLMEPGNAPAGWKERWLASERLSLAQSFAQADCTAILAELSAVEDSIAARGYLAAVIAERPAAQIVEMLGALHGPVAARRAEQVATQLAQADPVLQLRGFKALAEAVQRPEWEDRAFHALAHMIEQDVAGRTSALLKRSSATATGPRQEIAHPGLVRVEAAARLDFGGGWTDTPPYSIEMGGTVLNAAVALNGQRPIIAEVERLDERTLRLESRDIGETLEPATAGEVLAYANPADPFALLKASLVLKGIVPADTPPHTPIADVLRNQTGGLRLATQTTIPRGSGLGTSSIMAGAVLAALDQLLSIETEQAQRFDEVLCLEQMLTTGGGWQDQVGGLVGGIKLATSGPGLPQQITLEPLRLAAHVAADLGRRMVLVYTGQQRLAKNLLRAVMGRWMARDPEMVWILGEIGRLAVAMRDALNRGDVDEFGRLLGEHWALNKRMDPGCTNPFLDDLFAAMEPHIFGGKLAGAGGGGFAFVIARDDDALQALKALPQTRYAGAPVALWQCEIVDAGFASVQR